MLIRHAHGLYLALGRYVVREIANAFPSESSKQVGLSSGDKRAKEALTDQKGTA